MRAPARDHHRRRGGALAVLVASCLGLAGIGVWAAADGVTYYRTPTELLGGPADHRTVRVGGLVLTGSLVESVDGSVLDLSDGATRLPVRYAGRFPDVVREGQGAVVEGRLDAAGVFHAQTVVLRHSNEYEPPEDR